MKVCFHKTDITPARPCRMGGYERKKESEGVLDPIELNTMALEVQGTLMVMAMLDCICLGKDFVEHIKEAVKEQLGLAKEQIIVSCIHTHSAPCFFKLTFENVPAETALTEAVQQQVMQDLVHCAQHLIPCTAVYETCSIDGIYGNRNVKEAWSDKSFHVIHFRKDAEELGILANISTHPTLLGGDNLMLSADLLGQVRKQLEQTYHTSAMISNGACGDVSTRFYRNGHDDLTLTSAAIYQQYLSAHTTQQLQMDSCRIDCVDMQVDVDFTCDPIHQQIRKRIEAADSPMRSLFLHKCDIKESFQAFTMMLHATIVSFDELMLITLPGDILSAFGRQIKEAFPDRIVLLICYTGDYCNYFVPQEQYGAYFETFNSRLPFGAADKFIQQVIKTAKSNIYIDK